MLGSRDRNFRPAMQVGVSAANDLPTGLKIRPAVVDSRSNFRNDASPQIGNHESASVPQSVDRIRPQELVDTGAFIVTNLRQSARGAGNQGWMSSLP